MLGSRREGGLHDVAGLADFVVADDAAKLVFALFGLAGGDGRGVVIHGEADALGEDEFEDGFAFAAQVDVFAVGSDFLRHQAHEAGEALGGAHGFAGVWIEAAAARDDAEDIADAFVVAGAGLDISTLAAHGREAVRLHFRQRARGVIERLLGIEHGLRGIPHRGEVGFQRGDAGGIPAGEAGELRGGLVEVVGAPVVEVFGGIGNEVFAAHFWGELMVEC